MLTVLTNQKRVLTVLTNQRSVFMSLIMHQVKKVIIVGLLVGSNDIKDDIRD